MTTCEFVQQELVAYRDGELPEQDRKQIAAHLQTCLACAGEEAQLAQVERMLAKMERLAPSANFSATFWQRLEQEKAQAPVDVLKPRAQQPSRLLQWWRTFRDSLSAWQVAPALVAAASVLIFFGYFFTVERMPTPAPQKQASTSVPAQPSAPNAPAGLTDKLGLFVNYRVIADLERFSHFDEIAAVQLPEQRETEVAKEDELPPELLKNPSFFTHYPLLKKMNELQHLETVLDAPPKPDDAQSHG